MISRQIGVPLLVVALVLAPLAHASEPSCALSLGQTSDLPLEIRQGLTPAVRQVLTGSVEEASFLGNGEKALLLASLDKAVAQLGGGEPPGSSGNGGNSGNGGGGGEPPPGLPGFGYGDPERVNPDPKDLQDLEAYLERPTLQKCVGETAMLLSVSTVVTAIGGVIVHWQTYAPPGQDRFWDFVTKSLFTSKAWKKAWDDPEFQHIMMWNSVLMTSLGALSCMGNKNAGRNLMTGISLSASAFDQWRTGRYSLRQTLVDVLWTRYVSFFKTGKVLQYSRHYAATNRSHPKVVEATLQAVSEMFGAFGYPLTSKLSVYLVQEGEALWATAVKRLPKN